LRLPVPEQTSRTLDDMERAHILAMLEDGKGNQTLAAEGAGF
jgi:hypothetical protein